MYGKKLINFSFLIFLSAIINYGYAHNKTSNISLSNGRYIFIDGGAYKGESTEAFEKSNLYSKYPWEIFSFEANPELIHFISKKPNAANINKTMWIDDKGVNFYFGISDGAGNLVNTKDTDKTRAPVHVESIDSGQWRKRNFKKEDIIYVKMDIEGAEYPILEKMLKDGSIKYIDKLYVEFHSWIMDDIYKSKDEKIVKAIEKMGIPVEMKDTDPGDFN